MNPYILKQANYYTVRDQKYDFAVLPWGATEAHNLHLPYGTDTLSAEKVAELSAAKAWERGSHPLILPSVDYGINSGQMEVPFCMHINTSTQMAIIDDIVFVLRKHNINKLVIFSGHGGNDFTPIARTLSLKYEDFLIFTVQWWRAKNDKEYFAEPGDHAGELETSCMMYMYPEIVLPLDKAGEGKSESFTLQALNEKWVWTQRKWCYTSKEDTGVGNPKQATKEKGQRFVDLCVDKVADFFCDLSKIEQESDLYTK